MRGAARAAERSPEGGAPAKRSRKCHDDASRGSPPQPPWVDRFIRRMVLARAPHALLRLCVCLAHAMGPVCPQRIDAFETFSGHRAVTEAHRSLGLRAVTFEKTDHPGSQCDWLADEGFVHVLCCDMRLVDGAQGTNAPVCSSWTWVGRSQTWRRVYRPLGDTGRAAVAAANVMVSRMVLHLYMLVARGVWWILEQPATSLLEDHPRFQAFLRQHTVYRGTIRMGAFGADSEKPTWLYSNHPWIREIDMLCSRWWHEGLGKVSLTTVLVRADGSRATTGEKREMKESQHYPEAFGEAVAAVHHRHSADLRRVKKQKDEAAAAVVVPDFWSAVEGEDCWEDADLSSLEAFLLS